VQISVAQKLRELGDVRGDPSRFVWFDPNQSLDLPTVFQMGTAKATKCATIP